MPLGCRRTPLIRPAYRCNASPCVTDYERDGTPIVPSIWECWNCAWLSYHEPELGLHHPDSKDNPCSLENAHSGKVELDWETGRWRLSIYALKVDNGWAWLVHEWLKSGDGRFGWSYVETADLHELRSRVASDGWDSLTDEERDCYHEALLSLDCGDYVVYVNVPEWGQCTLAEVTGKYFWRCADNDFNHRFSVDRNSVCSFDTNDTMVPQGLRVRLKRRPRCYRINAEEEFGRLVEALQHGAKTQPRTLADNPHSLTDETEPFLSTVAEKIRHVHPDSDLEHLLEQVFRRVPGVRSVTRQATAGDLGTDLVVEFELGSIPQLLQTLVVQIRPGQGILMNPTAADDIRHTFRAYDADMALFVSAAVIPGPAVERQLDRLREKTLKPVALLSGDELAAFLWRHGSDLLTD